MRVKKYPSVPDIVKEGKLSVETPEQLIPKNKVEEYKNILQNKKL